VTLDTAERAALVPLRAFLGFTFCFAGLQKLANPGFFEPSNPGSIQAQLAGSARLSPVHSLVAPLAPIAVPLGLLIAFSELAIGLGTLLGLWQRLAAAGGVVLSLMLFLTVSFHSSPYYTGADIVFAFAWTPLLLAGAGPVLSADAAIAARAKRESRRAGPRVSGGPDPSRREATMKGTLTLLTAIGALALGGLTAGLGRAIGGLTGDSGASRPPRRAAAPKLGPSASGSGGGHPGGHPGGKALGPARDVPVGGAAGFRDPRTGDPSIVIQPAAGKFLAFDAVCPHAGCTVQYDRPAALFICPCHNSRFNAATGAVEAGPAPTGLTPIPVTKGGNGDLYAT